MFKEFLHYLSHNWYEILFVIFISLAVLITCLFIIQKKAKTWLEKKVSLKTLALFASVYLLIMLLIYSFVVIGVFVENFQSKGLQDDFEKWGQVGDFFGGMLNPILAFASFIALLYTIRIQSEELRVTRDEFQESLKAQRQMADEAKMQSDIAKVQLVRNLATSFCSEAKERFQGRNLLDGFASTAKNFKPTLMNDVPDSSISTFKLSDKDNEVLSFLVSFLELIDGFSDTLITKKGFIVRNPGSVVSKQQSEALAKVLSFLPTGNLWNIFVRFGLPDLKDHPTIIMFSKFAIGYEIKMLSKNCRRAFLGNVVEQLSFLYLNLNVFERCMLFNELPAESDD